MDALDGCEPAAEKFVEMRHSFLDGFLYHVGIKSFYEFDLYIGGASHIEDFQFFFGTYRYCHNNGNCQECITFHRFLVRSGLREFETCRRGGVGLPVIFCSLAAGARPGPTA